MDIYFCPFSVLRFTLSKNSCKKSLLTEPVTKYFEIFNFQSQNFWTFFWTFLKIKCWALFFHFEISQSQIMIFSDNVWSQYKP